MDIVRLWLAHALHRTLAAGTPFPRVVGLAGPEPPRAILVVSGHYWETDAPAVNVIRGTNGHTSIPALLGSDFTSETNVTTVIYPAPGWHAGRRRERAKRLLEDAGFGPVAEDRHRGLDHGAWVPLMPVHPEARARVPALGAHCAHHYGLGRALREEEGVLVVGSWSATHNLRALAPGSDEPAPRWAAEFDGWLQESLLGGKRCGLWEPPAGDGSNAALSYELVYLSDDCNSGQNAVLANRLCSLHQLGYFTPNTTACVITYAPD